MTRGESKREADGSAAQIGQETLLGEGLSRPLVSFLDYRLDGFSVLQSLVQGSPYRSLAQAIASLTIFSSPETVRQTGNKPVIRVIRNASRRGEVIDLDGKLIGLDDNKAPTDVFMWCNGLTRRPRDIQFNHIYSNSKNPDLYTCLANICITPSFLSKLTDTDPGIKQLLRYRAWDLYQWRPADHLVPEQPVGYGDLVWAPCLPPVPDVRATFAAVALRRPKDRTVVFGASLGVFPE